MSLQVWLPLTGHLNNQGIDDITVTNNGATVDNSGKLGQCYYFNGNNNYIGIPNYSSMGDTFTIAMWFNCAALGVDRGLCCNRSSTYSGFTAYINSTGKLILDPCAASYSSATRWTTKFTASANTWYHLTIIRTPTTISYYINGEFEESKDVQYSNGYGNYFSIGSFQKSGASFGTYYYGKINDVRIYDHALSAKEVQLLSQGLVAHYKLTGWLDGINPNMLKLIPKAHNPSIYLAYQFDLTENLVAGETYTIQLWDVDVSHSEKSENSLGVWVYWGGGSVNLLNWTGTNHFTNGHADHLTATFTVTSSQASGSGASNAWLNIYNSVGYVAGTMNMSIGRWKLEKGDTATPYCHTTEEMGGEDTTVYDCSGYNYHGTKIGDLTVSSDTPRYSVSTYFNGLATNYIEAPSLPTSVVSVSFWVKCPTNVRGVAFADMNTHLSFGFYSSTTVICYCGTSNGGTGSYCTIGSEWKSDDWNHVVLIATGSTTRDVYVNGSKLTPTSVNYWTHTTDNLMIGRRSYASSYYNGKISDFRAYATALSEDDIKELYHTSASIDKDGNLYAYELKEG